MLKVEQLVTTKVTQHQSYGLVLDIKTICKMCHQLTCIGLLRQIKYVCKVKCLQFSLEVDLYILLSQTIF